MYGMSPKRARNSYSGSKIMSSISRALSRSRGRKSNSFARNQLASRVHAFKRLAVPMTITSVSGAFPTINTPTVGNGTGFLTLGTPIVDTLDQNVQFGGAIVFKLSQCANYTEITNLFDNYRITRVRLMCSLSCNGADISQAAVNGSAGANLPGAMPIIHYTQDNDDSTVPTGITSVLENSYCRSYRMGSGLFNIDLQPRAQATVQASAGAAVSGGVLSKSQWLDNGQPGIEHYGLKFWIQNWGQHRTNNGVFSMTITPVYYLEAKNVV